MLCTCTCAKEPPALPPRPLSPTSCAAPPLAPSRPPPPARAYVEPGKRRRKDGRGPWPRGIRNETCKRLHLHGFFFFFCRQLFLNFEQMTPCPQNNFNICIFWLSKCIFRITKLKKNHHPFLFFFKFLSSRKLWDLKKMHQVENLFSNLKLLGPGIGPVD